MHRKRPSHTAKKIAGAVVYLGGDPTTAALLPEGSAEASERVLVAAGQASARAIGQMRKPWARRLFNALERRIVPGQTLHVGLRKRFFDDEARDALAAGATQVLVVGAGFDTLCLRLAREVPGALFVEIDHPVTQGAKLRAVETMRAGRNNLHLVEADLAARSLEDALRVVPGWSRVARSVVVAEGLLMYLSEPAVAAFFEGVHALTGPGTRLLFSYLETDEHGRVVLGRLARTMRVSLRMIGEPLLWGIRPQELPAFLEPLGWHVDSAPERIDLRRRYLDPSGLGDRVLWGLEHLAAAEKG